MRGVIYARYSAGPGQTDMSIEGQVNDCKRFASRNNIDVIEVYADRHISGKSTEGRTEFLRMIRDAKKGLFDCCIVWKIDRFGRDRRDIAIYKHELKAAGVKLLYAEESVPEGPEGIILESVLEGLAEYYSADLRQKVSRGIRETARKGEWCQPLPIGYTTNEQRHIVLDEPAATCVRKCFEMHIADAKTQEIVDMFNSYGVKGKKGSEMSKATIWRILRNERYLGRFSLQGVDVPAPAIIDEATFEEAKKHFKTSRHNGAGKAKTDYLLSTKCYCSSCGIMLRGYTCHNKKGIAYHYYRCPSCSMLFGQNKLESQVAEHITREVLKEDFIAELTDKILEVQEEELRASGFVDFEKQLRANKQKQANIVSAIEAGGGNALVARLNALELEAEDLEIKIASEKVKKPRLTKEVISAWLNHFVSGDLSDESFTRQLLNTFVARVDAGEGSITVYLNISGDSGVCVPSHIVDLSRRQADTKEIRVLGEFIIAQFSA